MDHADAGVPTYHMIARPLPIITSAQPICARGRAPTPRRISLPVTMLEGTVESMIGSKATPVPIGLLPSTP